MLYQGTIVYDVPYKGKWYRIDALLADVKLYEDTDVPKAVAERAVSALADAFYSLDHLPDAEETRSTAEKALKDEFGDAKFIYDTYPYGIAT